MAGRAAAVTDGSQGTAYARRFAAKGAQAAATDTAPAETLVAETEKTGGTAFYMNVTEARVARMAMATVETHGRIDLLVNNTRGDVEHKPMMEIDKAERERVPNVDRLFNRSKAVMPTARKDGKTVNVLSGRALKAPSTCCITIRVP